jgi:sugar O-acyltransferase (sialic acid O-acetyltransferase NeuD family)
MNNCIVIGGGGHAKTVLDAMWLQRKYHPVGIIDRNPTLKSTSVLGVPVIGNDSEIPTAILNGVTHFIIGLGSVADNSERKRLYEMMSRFDLSAATVIHPSATIATTAKLGRGTVVLAGAIINPDAVVNDNVIVNSGALVEHDCIIESHAHVCPGVRLSGGVHIQEGVFVGAGASVKQCISIGAWATVGMGSVVVRPVESKVKVAGVPARILRSKV